MENQETVSYTVYETAQARADRRFRSMLWVIVMLIVMLVGTNGAWLIYESQFEDIVMTETTQDGEGVNIIGNGDITYGAEKNGN